MNVQLKKFYEVLKENTQKHKKTKVPSAILAALSIKSTDQAKIIRESAIKPPELSKQDISSLELHGFIRKYGNSDYVITARGVWQCEQEESTITINKLLEYMQDKYYTFDKIEEKELTPKFKIILLAMLALRAFSKNNPLNLRTNREQLDKWKLILEKCDACLKETAVIPSSELSQIFTSENKTEHPVSYVFRHVEALAQGTRGLFQNPGGQKYYLEVYDNEKKELNEDKLITLFQQIFFKTNLTSENKRKIEETIMSLYNDYSIQIYDFENMVEVDKPENRKIIERALKIALV